MAIVRLARDPSLGERMGKNGRSRVHEKFSMEVCEAGLEPRVARVGGRGVFLWRRVVPAGVYIYMLPEFSEIFLRLISQERIF